MRAGHNLNEHAEGYSLYKKRWNSENLAVEIGYGQLINREPTCFYNYLYKKRKLISAALQSAATALTLGPITHHFILHHPPASQLH